MASVSPGGEDSERLEWREMPVLAGSHSTPQGEVQDGPGPVGSPPGPAPTASHTPRRRRRRRLLWLGIPLVAVPVAGVIAGTVGHDEPAKSVDWPLPAGRVVVVQSTSADVRVVADDTVENTLRIRSSNDNCEPAVVLGGTTASVSFSCQYADQELHVAPGTAVRVETKSGDVAVSGGLGDTAVRTEDGDVELAGGRGNTQVATSSGNVDLSGAVGDVAVSTESGGVDLRDVSRVPKLSVSTESGSIDAAGLGAERMVDAQTESGSESVAEQLRNVRDQDGAAQFRSRSGSIELSAD